MTKSLTSFLTCEIIPTWCLNANAKVYLFHKNLSTVPSWDIVYVIHNPTSVKTLRIKRLSDWLKGWRHHSFFQDPRQLLNACSECSALDTLGKPRIVPERGARDKAFPSPQHFGNVTWMGGMGKQVQHTMVFSSR